MTITNGYCTLTEFKNYVAPRGQSSQITSDATDDGVMSAIIEGVSRWIDEQCNRTFYPRVETRYFDVPRGRHLMLDDDLLAVITITNGDDTTVASTEYNPVPRNYTPCWGIQLKDTSTVYWTDNNGSYESVIDVLAFWGYRSQYSQRAWVSAGTISADMTAIASTFTMTAGHTLLNDQIIKIDNEVMSISVATNTVTPAKRGDNGSTAAVHTSGATVYIWNVQPEIREATRQIAQSLYSARSGQVSAGKVTITASGVVIRPEDVPPMAQQTIRSFTRMI